MAAAVTAENILGDLQKFWASLADESGSAGSHGVLRASSLSLLVLADESDSTQEIAGTLAEVMRDHPHRAIIVQSQPGAPLDYHVAAQCWLPFGQRQQICCEQIEITGDDAALADLGPVLLAIAAPDLPVVAWWRSARLARSDAARRAFAGTGKVIVDSEAFGDAAQGLEFVAGSRRMADLSWTRITRWREIVAQVFADPARQELLSDIGGVRVFHAEPKTPATAYYLAAWIQVSLGRTISARFEQTQAIGGGIEGIVLSGRQHTVSMRRVDGPAVLIEVDSLKSCTASPRMSIAELLGSELAITTRDSVFEKALPAAARMAGERR